MRSSSGRAAPLRQPDGAGGQKQRAANSGSHPFERGGVPHPARPVCGTWRRPWRSCGIWAAVRTGRAETCWWTPQTLTRWDVPDHLMSRMRSSVVFLGAILARCGQAEMTYPGGCELGARPIDLHLAALRSMGAAIQETGRTAGLPPGAPYRHGDRAEPPQRGSHGERHAGGLRCRGNYRHRQRRP